MTEVKACSNTVNGSTVPVCVDSVTVNLFFDGTGNNMYNTDEFEKFSDKKQKKLDDDVRSYANAYSNVAWLYKRRIIRNETWIYIEGIGTRQKDEDDEVLGNAFGDGDTGIVERAKQACKKIVNLLGEKTPSMLYINVFGFSRGAAAARHFVHLVKSTPEEFEGWNISKNQIRFKFVGLFDTVSSYQFISGKSALVSGLIPVIQAANHDFDNDVKELGLDFKVKDLKFTTLGDSDKRITKVFQIIAADEYRENFSITNIDSAMAGGYGYEVIVNGTHCDIGGAYKKVSTEKYDIEIEDDKLKNWLIKKRFYTTGDIKKMERSWIGGLFLDDYYRCERTVKYDIHKITLEMMARMATDHGGLTFTKFMSEYYEDRDPTVQTLMGHIPDKVCINPAWGHQITHVLPENEATKELRHKFVHWSAKYIKGSATDDTGFGLRRTEDGTVNGEEKSDGIPTRKVIFG